jgi:hypothetical protein
LDGSGNFYRSPEIKPIVLGDRIGEAIPGTADFIMDCSPNPTQEWASKGRLVGDTISRLKQTLMFDLGIVTKEEVHGLIRLICWKWKRELR